jgi:nitroreductase
MDAVPATPKEYPREPYRPYAPVGDPTSLAQGFYDAMRQRRTVRDYSDKPVPRSVIERCILAAGTAPSGANKQPWRFVAISDPVVKRAVREAAEHEEREFYARRATPEWLADLAPLGTDARKPFLEVAPWIVVVFKLTRTDPDESGAQGKTYYTEESVGIAVGMFLTACHLAGLATLTHTPSPMGFLSHVLGRPAHERAFLVIPVGYAAADATVPAIGRKPLDQIAVFREGGGA